jgi:uncharacterized protein YneF (UPF0154 family)
MPEWVVPILQVLITVGVGLGVFVAIKKFLKNLNEKIEEFALQKLDPIMEKYMGDENANKLLQEMRESIMMLDKTLEKMQQTDSFQESKPADSE